MPVVHQLPMHVRVELMHAWLCMEGYEHSGTAWMLTRAVLADELMHAWLRMEGYEHLPQQVEEVLCHLMAYQWL